MAHQCLELFSTLLKGLGMCWKCCVFLSSALWMWQPSKHPSCRLYIFLCRKVHKSVDYLTVSNKMHLGHHLWFIGVYRKTVIAGETTSKSTFISTNIFFLFSKPELNMPFLNSTWRLLPLRWPWWHSCSRLRPRYWHWRRCSFWWWWDLHLPLKQRSVCYLYRV